jgi:hypothetical protein
MSPPRDTPAQIDRAHALGALRDLELNGVGTWRHPDHPGSRWSGAANALAALRGQPLPYPQDGGLPWAA